MPRGTSIVNVTVSWPEQPEPTDVQNPPSRFLTTAPTNSRSECTERSRCSRRIASTAAMTLEYVCLWSIAVATTPQPFGVAPAGNAKHDSITASHTAYPRIAIPRETDSDRDYSGVRITR